MAAYITIQPSCQQLPYRSQPCMAATLRQAPLRCNCMDELQSAS